MGNTYGRQVLSPTIGYPLSVLANLDEVTWKAGGLTLDWATVAAAGSDVTYINGDVLVTGQKGLRYGQILTRITASGKFGPYDPAASDGRQLLVRGDCFILEHTVFENGVIPQLGGPPSNHPPALDGGLLWKDRVLMTTGTHTLAAGPTVTEFLAAFPDVHFAQN
jgi:hypothetical protein